MIHGHRIGKFVLSVAPPYPVWITIDFGGNTIQFRHIELADLEHAIRLARREATRLLCSDAG